jgi:hypothetical protein
VTAIRDLLDGLRMLLDAVLATVSLLVWHATGSETGGRHTLGGVHRLDRQPEHQGYADWPEKLTELVEVRGRHAA